MKTPQIIEIDLSKFYSIALKRIVNAYAYKSIEDVENEIVNFIDEYEALVGNLDEV